MSELQRNQQRIADATAEYTAASDAPTIQKQINDKIGRWAAGRRAAGDWVADSDVASEHSKMAGLANAELQAAAERVQETIALGTLACERMERDAEQIVPYWQRDTVRKAGDYISALSRLSWDNATALAATSFRDMSWSQIRAEHRAAIAANDDVKLALIEDKTKRATFAAVGRPTLEDIEAQFQLTKGRTGEIEQQRASRHPIETRQFRAYLETVQPSPLKSMVLKFVVAGKRKVA